MTKVQKNKLGNLLAAHRAVEGVADYQESPTMQAVFKYVDHLLANQLTRICKKRKRGK